MHSAIDLGETAKSLEDKSKDKRKRRQNRGSGGVINAIQNDKTNQDSITTQMVKKSLTLFVVSSLLLATDASSLPIHRCTPESPLDVIFMVDSSGSVWDERYKNWLNELDLVYEIIGNVLPSDSKVGLIKFSGCGSSFSLQECRDLGRLKKMIGLNDNGIPNDLQAVLSIIDAIDEDDFNGGYTWIEEALHIALTEFNANSTADRSKMIVLLSDGAPYPYNQGHEPCKRSTNYVSPTLTFLREELNVEIITVGIDISGEHKDEYFTCMSDFYFEATFNSSLVEDIHDQIGDTICSELNLADFEASPAPVCCDVLTLNLLNNQPYEPNIVDLQNYYYLESNNSTLGKFRWIADTPQSASPSIYFENDVVMNWVIQTPFALAVSTTNVSDLENSQLPPHTQLSSKALDTYYDWIDVQTGNVIPIQLECNCGPPDSD